MSTVRQVIDFPAAGLVRQIVDFPVDKMRVRQVIDFPVSGASQTMRHVIDFPVLARQLGTGGPLRCGRLSRA